MLLLFVYLLFVYALGGRSPKTETDFLKGSFAQFLCCFLCSCHLPVFMCKHICFLLSRAITYAYRRVQSCRQLTFLIKLVLPHPRIYKKVLFVPEVPPKQFGRCLWFLTACCHLPHVLRWALFYIRIYIYISIYIYIYIYIYAFLYVSWRGSLYTC